MSKKAKKQSPLMDTVLYGTKIKMRDATKADLIASTAKMRRDIENMSNKARLLESVVKAQEHKQATDTTKGTRRVMTGCAADLPIAETLRAFGMETT